MALALVGNPSGVPGSPAVENFWRWDTLRKILLSPAGMLMLLIFIMSFGMTNFQGIVGLYVVEKFDFDTRQVGAIWMVLGVVMIISQGVLTGLLTKFLGDVTIIRIGLLVGALGFGALLLANGFIPILLATGFLYPGGRADWPGVELLSLGLWRRAPGRADGVEHGLRQPGARRWAVVGGLHLRCEHHLPVCQRGRHPAGGFRVQPAEFAGGWAQSGELTRRLFSITTML